MMLTRISHPDRKFLVGGGRAKFSGELICKHVHDAHGLQDLESASFVFEAQCKAHEIVAIFERSSRRIAITLPLPILMPFLTRYELLHAAKGHGVGMYSRVSVNEAKQIMSAHICHCPDVVSIMSIVEIPPRSRENKQSISKANAKAYIKKMEAKPQPSPAHRLKMQADILQQAKKIRFIRKVCQLRLRGTAFPPRPARKDTLHRIITNSSESVQADRFLGAGCAVCGRLTPQVELTPLDQFDGSLEHLRLEVVTRKERFSSSDPIEELPGPVLADGCTHICIACEVPILKKVIPRDALANYNWVGMVPPQLQGLTYAEGVMIARVRHNRCVMRVNSGRVRMHANAIMFAQPALKVYLKLPPSRDEISEVLAFIFTGSAAPTQEDFDRTPMLVRRHKVAAALEWLKLNHEDYADLEISQENLMSYAHRDIPVSVDYKHAEGKPNDSIPAEARSVFDKNEEHGTTDGECTFAVHGLTGAEYSTASMSTIKAAALQHLTHKGDMLAIGRSDILESMYHNVKAYPGMFPWLFPYGKGGIGHAAHKFKLGDMTHKRNLLLYHDKRFQTDTYFPMVAFNHEQLKGSS